MVEKAWKQEQESEKSHFIQTQEAGEMQASRKWGKAINPQTA